MLTEVGNADAVEAYELAERVIEEAKPLGAHVLVDLAGMLLGRLEDAGMKAAKSP